MGKVIVVGIGPGSYEDMTIRADRALQSCDAIVGYGVYVDLVKERYLDKAFYETPMTQEAKRCALALDLARAGKTAAMVCSGDSGIYGMAALMYELRGESEEPEIEVVPGLTAACSAAALFGRAADARLCRHQPERPPDAVGRPSKAPDARGKGRPDHRPLQSREPFAARTFEACV